MYYKNEEHKTRIAPLDEGPYHTYTIDPWESQPVNLSAQTLLDIAAYVKANRTRLEQEAEEDLEQNEHLTLDEIPRGGRHIFNGFSDADF